MGTFYRITLIGVFTWRLHLWWATHCDIAACEGLSEEFSVVFQTRLGFERLLLLSFGGRPTRFVCAGEIIITGDDFELALGEKFCT